MKRTIRDISFSLAIVLSAATSASPQIGNSLPSAEDVVAKMLQRDAERRSELAGYTAQRRYVAANRDRRAEMVVRVDCSADARKQFTTISEKGSSAIRKHVFYKMLSEESEASRRETRDSSRITPENYKFKVVGQETLEARPAYVLAIIPKTDNRYLIDGQIWVDAEDFSIVRIEGRPARNPSFWVRNVHFVHTYQRVGQFWLASSTHSTSEVRIFGTSELTIENSEYALKSEKTPSGESESLARLAK